MGIEFFLIKSEKIYIFITMKYTKENIIEIIHINRDKLRDYGLSDIGLFGSFVRDEGTENSDIDLLIEFEKGKKNFDNFMNLAFFIDSLFNTKVDLITKKSLKEFMKEKILKEVYYVPLSS